MAMLIISLIVYLIVSTGSRLQYAKNHRYFNTKWLKENWQDWWRITVILSLNELCDQCPHNTVRSQCNEECNEEFRVEITFLPSSKKRFLINFKNMLKALFTCLSAIEVFERE